MSATTGKQRKIGTSGPIDADGGGPQRARQASGMGFGRAGTICKYIEIMQILPGSSDNAALINATRTFCKLAQKRTARSELKIQELQPLPHPEQRDRERNR